MKLPHILTALGINAVPALGWFLGDWNSGTTLAVYWFETVVATLLIAARTLVHRRKVRVRGHFAYASNQPGFRGAPIPFLRHYLPVALAFSTAHAVFLVAIIFLLTQNGRGAEVRLNFSELGLGCLLILGFQLADFGLDLVRLKSRPFRWIEVMAERNMGRVLIIHMTLLVGMLVAAMTESSRGFFLVFVVLKTMNDLAMILPQYDPEEPPRWLCRLMDKVPNTGKKTLGKEETFADFWKRGKTEERARQAKNELPYQG
jgi:hypothetical protein